MSSLRRRMIKKAQKEGLRVISGDFYDQFHEILGQALNRHSAEPVHSVEEMRLLASRFPDQISLHGAFNKESLCAGLWLFDFGRVVHTQYLASSEAGRACGALDFLIADVIEQYSRFKKGLSFGISTEESGRYLNEGLVSHKEGFGARGITLDSYEINLS